MMTQKKALPKDLKTQNYEEIFRSLFERKRFIVSEIVNETGLSRLTVTRAINYFLEKQLLVSAGKGSSTNIGGKKPEQYMLNGCKYILCVSSNNHGDTYTLINFTKDIVSSLRKGFATEKTYRQYLADIAWACDTLLSRHHIPSEDFYGVAICTGGVVDSRSGLVSNSTCPQWGERVALAEDVRSVLGRDVVVHVENVAKVSAGTLRFAEQVRGKRTAMLYADYGISIVTLEEGKLTETAHSVVGELGHMCIDPNDDEVCGCGAKGCFEVLVSERRLVRMISGMQPEPRERLLRGYDGIEDVREYLLREEGRGNPLARPLVEYMAGMIGLALRNVYLGFDPDQIMIAGAFSNGSDAFIEAIKDRIRENRYLRDIDIDIQLMKRPIIDLLNEGGLNLMLSEYLERESKN